MSENFFSHPTANIEDSVSIGDGSKIWAYAHIRKNTKIGQNCIVAEGVFIDEDSEIGDNCKIQNHSLVYHKAILADGVFIGPNVCFTNDKQPRAINPDGTLKSAEDWTASEMKIGTGAAIGGQTCITPGVTIGKWAMAGSGSVITKDVPDYALVYGNPAKIHGFVCACGKKLTDVISEADGVVKLKCECGEEIEIKEEIYNQII